jgi:menaquinone-dependent protoporphyrinogen oxidase
MTPLSAAAGEHGDEESVERCAQKFLYETGWAAREVHHAAGALRFTQYDFFKKWIMRQIAKSQGYDASGEDVEFTDWRALDAFVESFVSASAPTA